MTPASEIPGLHRPWVRPRVARTRITRDLKRAVADTCYVALRLSGWLMTTGLASLGLLTLFFLMIGNFTDLGFFSQIANLGDRFVAADASRRLVFMGQVHVVEFLVFGFVSLMRFGLLVQIISLKKGPAHG